MICPSFIFGLLVGVALLILPGYLVARALLAEKMTALCVAPALSVAVYNILAVLYSLLGLFCSALTLALPLVVCFGFLDFLAVRRGLASRVALSFGEDLHGRPIHCLPLSWANISVLAAVLGSLLVSIVFYLSNINSSSAYLPYYDNAYHLTRLRTFFESGVYSSLSGGFYPSAWHCLGAMIMSVTNCSITVAAQASTVSFVACAFPLGMSFFLGTVFPHHPRRVIFGSLLCLCTWFFPWKILLFGPLYPNVASFTLMPATLGLFIRLFGEEGKLKERFGVSILLMLSGVALVFAQPNTVFFSYIFLIPYLMMRVRTVVSARVAGKRGTVGGVVAEAMLFGLAIAIWIFLLSLPFMQSLVAYERDQPYTFLQAVPKLLTFQFVIWRPQYLLCLLLVFGCLRQLFEKETRWAAFSYGALGFVYLASVGLNGSLRGYISGFCYNDYYRTAACVCIAAVPLVATGLDSVVFVLTRAVLRIRPGSEQRVFPSVACVAIAVFCGFNYFPLFEIPRFASWGFDSIAYLVNDGYNEPLSSYYTSEEEEFVRRAKEICGSSLVVNQPYDGSVFSYSLDGLNVLFTQFAFDQAGDKAVLKDGLGNIAADSVVSDAARRLGAAYVLQLDQGSSFSGMSPNATYYDFSYDPAEWTGINMIRDDTPGFEVVLSDGDMRLYKIVN